MSRRPIQVHECIYTSAARVLGPGGGNLGVVARSSGFPRDVESELAPLSGYSLLPQLPIDNPDLHPSRYVIALRGSAKNAYCISRIVFAGADHTGRTTPLAHHVVVDPAKIANNGLSVAAFLSEIESHFENRWNKEPEEFNPPRELSTTPAAQPSIPTTWSKGKFRDSLPVLADALLNYPITQRPLLFVVDPASPKVTLSDLSWLLSLLPSSLQPSVAIASHVISPADYVRDASIIFTYTNSSFHTQCLRRQDLQAPIVVDLDRSGPINFGRSGHFAATLKQAGASPGTDAFNELLAEWDRHNFQPKDADVFRCFVELKSSLATATSRADIQSFGIKINSLIGAKSIGDSINNIATTAVSDRFASLPETTRSDVLLAICADERWPRGAKNEAASQLIESPGILELVRQTDVPLGPVLVDAIRDNLANDEAQSDFIFESLSSKDGQAIRAFVDLVRPDLHTSARWVRQLTMNPREVPTSLNHLRRWVASSVKAPADLISIANTSEDRAAFLDTVAKPVFWEKVRSASSSHEANGFADELIQIGLQENTLDEVVREMRGQPSYHVDKSVLQRWRMLAANARKADALAQAIRRAGFEISETTASPCVEKGPTPTRAPLVRTGALAQPAIIQGTAGPRRSALFLAALLIVFSAVTVVFDHSIWPKAVAFGSLGAVYLVIDFLVSCFWPVSRSISPVRTARWILVSALLIACIIQGFVMKNQFLDLIHKIQNALWPATQPTSVAESD